MKLYYSPTSPYARKVRAIAIEKGLDDRLEIIPAREPGVNLEKRNPLNKVPTLETDDGEVLIESALIGQHLDDIGSGARLYPEPTAGAERRRALQIEALVHGVLDAAVLCRLEEREREPEMRSAKWVARQQKKIALGLAMIEDMLDEIGQRFSAAHITLACLLFFLDQHKLHEKWRADRPKLAAWYEEICQRPSLATTEPKLS